MSHYAAEWGVAEPTSSGGGVEAVGVLHQEPEFRGGSPVGAGGWQGAGWGLPAPAERVWGAGKGVWVLGVKLGYPAPSRGRSLVSSRAKVGPAGHQPLP